MKAKMKRKFINRVSFLFGRENMNLQYVRDLTALFMETIKVPLAFTYLWYVFAVLCGVIVVTAVVRKFIFWGAR